MVVVALPLGPEPYPAKNGTILGDIGATYHITLTAHYVLISDTRNYLSCTGYTNCTVRLSGTVAATLPAEISQYANFPTVLGILGVLVMIPPVLWVLWKGRHGGNVSTEELSS